MNNNTADILFNGERREGAQTGAGATQVGGQTETGWRVHAHGQGVGRRLALPWWLSDLRPPPSVVAPWPAQAVLYKLGVTPAHHTGHTVVGPVCLPSWDKALFLPPQHLAPYPA